MTDKHLKKFYIKLFLILIVFLSLLNETYAQQFSLYNSRTLYDSFENPSQRAYQVDTSKRFAFNFFIPVISINGTFSGPAGSSFKSLLYDGVFNGRDLTIGQNRLNIMSLNSNNYIAMFRVLKDVKQYQEMGVSWQIRNDGRAQVTNEVFAIFDNYERFDQNTLENIFNVKGYNQAYHQFSFTYRKNYTKRFAVGAKFSLLSGIGYSSIKVNKSKLNIDPLNKQFELSISGRVRSSFEFDNFKKEMIKPFFKNPGLSFTLGGSYHLRDGWTILGNLKDIGFIKWSNQAFEYNFDTGAIVIDNASATDADNRLADSLDSRVNLKSKNRSYLSAINGKAEVMISKEFGDYKPNLIFSKSIYYDGGNIALINNYHFKNYVFTASTDYNTNGFLQVGGQFMIKTPNIEFYMGSDQLLSSYRMFREYKSSTPYSSSYTGTSFYMGFGLKFGKVLEHQANATVIPGFKKEKTGGFIKKLFGKKE